MNLKKPVGLWLPLIFLTTLFQLIVLLQNTEIQFSVLFSAPTEKTKISRNGLELENASTITAKKLLNPKDFEGYEAKRSVESNSIRKYARNEGVKLPRGAILQALPLKERCRRYALSYSAQF